ncbi:MAG: hypothetical protein PSX80_13905 [bacterium]|nr:hypothetical protein [bacterium]
MLYGLLAFVSLLATIFSFLAYRSYNNTLALVAAIVFLIATVGLGGVFLSGRVNKKEEIHITE